ncbi:unnamed protein product, partial [Rotaria sp. Silwood2]
VSYQAPGRQDSITIKVDGIKQTLQKRFLLFSLREVYQLFIDEYPQHKIGRSSFQELRPPNVLYKSSMPHNVCICKYHENIDLLITALSEHIQDFKSIDLQSFIKLLVCDENREVCMFSNCDECSEYFKDKVENKIIDKTRVIKWTLWTTSAIHQTLKVDYNGTVFECVKVLSTRIKHFLLHVFIKRQQSQYFESAKHNVTDKRCLLQIDYSENYSLVEQNQVQSLYWSTKQLSIFTANVWTQLCTYPMVIVSNDISHNKWTVAACLEYIFSLLKSLIPSLDEIIIISDGSSSQFKNQ